MISECGMIWSEIVEGSHKWQRDAEMAAAVRIL